ncbi:MAG: hypothetical protein LUO89_07870, partial [Methanothrix sp.]|nr:hypothetical protein [Methanothrix sp.]
AGVLDKEPQMLLLCQTEASRVQSGGARGVIVGQQQHGRAGGSAFDSGAWRREPRTAGLAQSKVEVVPCGAAKRQGCGVRVRGRGRSGTREERDSRQREEGLGQIHIQLAAVGARPGSADSSMAKVFTLRVRLEHGLFPLTLALSLREREPPTVPPESPDAPRLADRLASILPLPKGKGRGEGNRAPALRTVSGSGLASAHRPGLPTELHGRRMIEEQARGKLLQV